jgi:hypothetical protein
MQCPQNPWLKKLSPRLKSLSPKLNHRVPSCAVKHTMHHDPNFILTLKSLSCSTAITVYKIPNHIIQSHNSFITPHIIFILQNIIIILIYSKIFKSSKTYIFNIQLVRIQKTTYIFCNSLIYENNSFLVSRIPTLDCSYSQFQ